jgi:hypothetical protein
MIVETSGDCRNVRTRGGTGRVLLRALLVIAMGLVWSSQPAAQTGAAEAVHRALDELLEVYVRDGYVYYRALRQDRARLDTYVRSLAGASIESEPRDAQVAFWLNAYNALVLRTVVDRYPIVGRSSEYPPQSIRQIPGAFERMEHRVAQRTVTLDQIEQSILPAFTDPRVFLALGRGAVGSGRLRSEAYGAANLERQLAAVASECATTRYCVQIDQAANRMMVSSIFSWRHQEFEPMAANADPAFAARSAIERAVLFFISPRLLAAERAFLAKNEFEIRFLPFDWTLNDLTGRGGR